MPPIHRIVDPHFIRPLSNSPDHGESMFFRNAGIQLKDFMTQQTVRPHSHRGEKFTSYNIRFDVVQCKTMLGLYAYLFLMHYFL